MLASLVKAHQDAPSEREGNPAGADRHPPKYRLSGETAHRLGPALSSAGNETHVERRGAAVQQNASSIDQ